MAIRTCPVPIVPSSGKPAETGIADVREILVVTYAVTLSVQQVMNVDAGSSPPWVSSAD